MIGRNLFRTHHPEYDVTILVEFIMKDNTVGKYFYVICTDRTDKKVCKSIRDVRLFSLPTYDHRLYHGSELLVLSAFADIVL